MIRAGQCQRLLLKLKQWLAAGYELIFAWQRMSTLAEIEMAVPHLDADELSHLERLIHSLRASRLKKQPSAFDLPPLQLGRVLLPLGAEDDLLEEMLSDSRD